jgi:endonuclease-3
MQPAKSKLTLRVRQILRALRAAYPDCRCALDHTNPLELLVATILSAQCTDARVNRTTPALFKKYRTAADYANAPAGELERDIKSTGFYRNKARAIRACCRAIADKHHGKVPDTMAELVPLAGIGRKTANVVLGVAYGKAEGVVVDTHVARLSYRLGLTRHRDPLKIEQELMAIVPQKDWIDFSHLLIWHGRRRCIARKPDCGHCELARLCPRIGVVSPASPPA